MFTSYTVIQAVRQRFGDGRGEYQVEQDAPFVGESKTFPFACPNVDRSQWGVLTFNALGVGNRANTIEVNGNAIPGGLYVGPLLPLLGQQGFDPPSYYLLTTPIWSTQSLLVDGSFLTERNSLFIQSAAAQNGGLDDFVVDNIVIWFKVRSPVPGRENDPVLPT